MRERLNGLFNLCFPFGPFSTLQNVCNRESKDNPSDIHTTAYIVGLTKGTAEGMELELNRIYHCRIIKFGERKKWVKKIRLVFRQTIDSNKVVTHCPSATKGEIDCHMMFLATEPMNM